MSTRPYRDRRGEFAVEGLKLRLKEISQVFHSVLVPLDGSKYAEAELGFSLDLVALDGTLHLVSASPKPLVVPSLPMGGGAAQVNEALESARHNYEDYLADIKALIQAARPDLKVTAAVDSRDPETTILEMARELEVDLVVMSAHEKSWIQRLLLGSTTENVIRQLKIPVLVVHPEHSVPIVE